MSQDDTENDGGWFDDVTPVVRKKRERTVERRFCLLCKQHGLMQRKLQDLGNRAYPDRTVYLGDGRTCCVELKRPGEKPSKEQLGLHEELRSLGIPVGWFDNADKAIEWVLFRRNSGHLTSTS